jgi:hypothetical protein
MAYKKRRKASKDQDAAIPGSPEEGGSAPPSQAGGTSSSMAGVFAPTTGGLVHASPTIVQSPFGEGYLSRRSRPIVPDETQMVYALWEFDIRGYWEVGTVTVTDPIYHDAGENQLLRTYQHFRDVIKFNRKPRLEVNELNDTSRFIDYLNTYHFVVANIPAIAAVYKMAAYNECFQNMNTYLPDKMVRLQRLWARASAIVVPDCVKMMALQDGMVANAPGIPAPHIRLWSHNNLVMYGNMGDYDEAALDSGWAGAGVGIYSIMSAAANIDSVLDDIQSAVEVLEGNMTAGADRTDVLGIKEVFEYISTVENFAPKFSQRLPAIMQMQPLVTDRSALNDWYCRGIGHHDTHGVGADSDVLFPVTNMDTLGERIPIKGFGPQSVNDFTLFGAWKFAAAVNNAADGTYYDASTGIAYRLMGTSRLYQGSNPSFYNIVQVYTREDQDENITNYATDLGDGADIRAWRNTEHPVHKHLYRGVVFASQLAADQEFHFLDETPTDTEMWAEAKDYPEHWAIFLAQTFGVPYLV